MHLKKEEEILFPTCGRWRQRVSVEVGAPPNMFGTVRNPILHDGVGASGCGARARTTAFDYEQLHGAGGRVRDLSCLLRGTQEAFDRDLRMHIHLENNVLFPKAVALEAALQRWDGERRGISD